MYGLLAIDIPTAYDEILLLGLQVVGIGMATVFSVLVLIWGILTLFKFFFGESHKKVVQDTHVVEEVVAPTQVASNDEIIAVIAAAIAAAESDSSGVKFRVVSFKRK